MSDEQQRDSRPTLFPKSVNGETTINLKLGALITVAAALGGVIFGGGVVRGDLSHTIEAVSELDDAMDEHDTRINAIDRQLSADEQWREAVESKLESAVQALTKNTEQITRLVTELEVARRERSRRER